MKAVLMSIQPKWCKLIALGKKTVEVRKTKPKLEVPFKVYIYCTKDNTDIVPSRILWKADKTGFEHILNGKVIGEFVCDRIYYVRNYGDAVDLYDCLASCLSAKEIIEYATDKNGNFVYTYGWHISDLVIYDKPRELGEFLIDCKNCSKKFVGNPNCWQGCVDGCRRITRPPQSWCYVERSESDGT